MILGTANAIKKIRLNVRTYRNSSTPSLTLSPHVSYATDNRSGHPRGRHMYFGNGIFNSSANISNIWMFVFFVTTFAASFLRPHNVLHYDIDAIYSRFRYIWCMWRRHAGGAGLGGHGRPAAKFWSIADVTNQRLLILHRDCRPPLPTSHNLRKEEKDYCTWLKFFLSA